MLRVWQVTEALSGCYFVDNGLSWGISFVFMPYEPLC